ncbi:MAG: hypothetical protein KKF65_03085 [Nanoarchaeota archaeon]|nr:hypothetical protein [Nanoarchaeota archaeon]
MSENMYYRKPEDLIELNESSGRILKSSFQEKSTLAFNIRMLCDRCNINIGEELKNYFHGHVIVDLGAGYMPSGYALARMAGASSYIAVEKYQYKELKENLENHANNDERYGWENDNPSIPYAVYSGDMLDFLSRIKNDDSVGMIFSWIDNVVLTGDPKELVSQMERVLHKDSAIFASNSIDLQLFSDNLKEEKIAGYMVLYRK